MAEYPWEEARAVRQRTKAATAAIHATGAGNGSMGLTPDSVKATAAYRAAKRDLDIAVSAERAFNSKWADAYKRIPMEERMRRIQSKDALPAPIPVCDSQVDTDAAELANAYKTQGEAAARRLWAEKIKGLNYGQQIILQDKMARLIKGKATDATQVPVGFAAGKSPEFRAAEWARRQTELKNSGPLRRPLPGKATDAARLHRALDAAMDARAKDELVMWGIPKGETERYKEVLLLSNGTPEKVARVKELATRDGFHSFRTANVNLGKPPSFGRNVLGKDARAKGRDTQFSTGERKETPAELAWRAATYEKREEMLKRAGLPDFESGHGWTLLPVDVRKKLNRLYK